MIPMRFREMTSCAEHKQDIIVLEDMSAQHTLAIAADPDESCRLAREVSRGPGGEHPIYDFLEGLLRTFGATATRVVLEHVTDAGLGGAVIFRRPEGEVSIPCYPSDALVLAQRIRIPIYVSPDVFAHVKPFRSAPPASDDGGQLAEWLERIRPEDFSSRSPSDRIAGE